MAQSFGSTVDVSDLRSLAAAFRAGPASLQRHMQTRMRDVGGIVADQAGVNSDWSTRIPESIKVRVSGLNITVSAGNDAAPHAAPYEHQGQPGTFMHPVFGNRSVWVQEAARPFLAPALDERTPDVVAGISDAVDDTLAEIGLA